MGKIYLFVLNILYLKIYAFIIIIFFFFAPLKLCNVPLTGYIFEYFSILKSIFGFEYQRNILQLINSHLDLNNREIKMYIIIKYTIKF